MENACLSQYTKHTPEVVVCEYMEALPANEVAEVFHGQVNCKELPI